MIGKSAKLLTKPNGYTSKDYPLTVGKWYTILCFDGSNVVTTTDIEGETASYNRDRLDLNNLK